MTVEYTIISIGTLSMNRLWGEGQPVRTSHATTTLVVEGKRRILVDPSLPGPALAARFFERTGKGLDTITDVFCTTLRPVHRRSIEALPAANWWTGPGELEAYREHLEGLQGNMERLAQDDKALVDADLRLVNRFKPAPDKFGEQVSLYPLFGPSPGSAGLLLTPSTSTVIIAGDAALTTEHVARAQVWEGCFDCNAALDSLKDLLELADVIIPGHDNFMLSPRHWM
jgi:glyoxylase-like metal-dependent hydrolase (beta-lactamase superfamily II)